MASSSPEVLIFHCMLLDLARVEAGQPDESCISLIDQLLVQADNSTGNCKSAPAAEIDLPPSDMESYVPALFPYCTAHRRALPMSALILCILLTTLSIVYWSQKDMTKSVMQHPCTCL